MKQFFLAAALLVGATAANASVTYSMQSTSFGSTGWQFTVNDFLSSAGTTYITDFDSYSSNFLGPNLLDIRVVDPFSATPSLITDTDNGSLGSASWTGPFNHDGTYTAQNSTLTITSTAGAAPEPSTFALLGVGGVLLALARRRRQFE